MNINSLPTFTFACFDKSIDSIENFINSDFREEIKKRKVFISKTKKDVDTVFGEFEELRRSRAVRIESNQYSYEAFFFNPLMKPDKTIMISSLEDGWFTLCNAINGSLHGEYCYFTLCDENISEPMNFFKYVNNEIERVVYATKEGKWIFYEHGETLPFEESSYYRQRMIKKRVTKQILIDYCKRLGLFIEDVSFWKSEKESLYVKYTW